MGSAQFDGVKVLTATFAEDRAVLGERLTAWLRANPAVRVTDVAVRQSSDARHHCLTLVVFYATGHEGAARAAEP